MAASVIVYQSSQKRSQIICNAMFDGIHVAGDDDVRIVDQRRYKGPDADIAVFYGLFENLSQVFRDYVQAGLKAVYIDLGYWSRKQPSFWEGWHKIAVNSRHPTAYFQRERHARDRINAMGIMPKAWRENPDGPILLAGMGDKAAEAEGFHAEEWERSAIERLRKVTNRRIVYRPKPSWKEARPIEGTDYSPSDQPLERVLRRSFAVVTHHSNVAVDALVEGIPAFCEAGVASPLAKADLSKIEDPAFPGIKERRQWLADVAYCQWSVPEMRQGLPWQHLKSEGLVA